MFTVPATIDSSETLSTPEVIVGMSITLHCSASGVPAPSVVWYRDGKSITGNTTSVTVLNDGLHLKIQDAEISHSARYSCVAENVAGKAEKFYDLSVLG